jgi:redox-sensitive bicupin YhaK (pirin superfamily)
MQKKIKHARMSPKSASMGPHVRQVIPSAVGHIDPIVFLDHFGPFERVPGIAGVPAHPHAGIATITYLYEGSNRHQDSLGNDCVVNPGDMAWMQAGSGIVHAEGMNEKRTEPEVVHGLQFWISLPAKDKFIAPDFFHYTAATLPTLSIGKAKVKVLCGALNGQQSPVQSLSPAFMYEVHIPANEQITIPLIEGNTLGLYMVKGAVVVDQKELLPLVMTAFEKDGDELKVSAEKDSHFVLFGGKALNEPIVGYASFVMNNMEQIQQVMDVYHSGKMGTI